MGYGGATWQQRCQAVRLLSDIFHRINDRKNKSLAACSVCEIYENLLVSSTSSSIDSNLLEVAGIITVPVKHQEVLQMLHQKEYRSWQNLHIQNFFKFKRSGSVLEVPRYRKYFSSLHILATSIYLSTCFDAESISPMELCSVDNLDSFYSYGAMSSTLSRSSFFVVTFFDMIS